jgi:CRISPR-associated endoribonuclease Cas6
MPAIVEMRLRPSRPLEPTTRQLHGLACTVFEGTSSPNHVSQDKPFTIWPLNQDPDGWLLRAAWLPSSLPHSVLAACGQLRIGPVTCAVTDLAFHPALHSDLASGPPLTEAQLTFGSPTYFTQNGTHIVQPDPRLIAGSWRRRWNTSLPDHDPLTVDDDQWRDLHHALRLTAYNLRTESRDTGHGHPQTGFTGTATLRLDKTASAPVRQTFGTLTRFAEFSGTGAQTTHGFGATSIIAARDYLCSKDGH